MKSLEYDETNPHHTLNFQTFGEDYVPYRTAYPVSPFPASPVCHTAVSHFAL